MYFIFITNFQNCFGQKMKGERQCSVFIARKRQAAAAGLCIAGSRKARITPG
jgi:hypothetical protein